MAQPTVAPLTASQDAKVNKHDRCYIHRITHREFIEQDEGEEAISQSEERET